MAFLLMFNSSLQVLAAFVIFLFGYLVFMALLLISLFIATGLYEGAKMIWAYAARFLGPRNAVYYLYRGAVGDGD
jgi:hypothetical protein